MGGILPQSGGTDSLSGHMAASNPAPRPLPETVWAILACPGCGGPLERTPSGPRCAACGIDYGPAETGQPDLRLRRSRPFSLDGVLEVPFSPEGGMDFQPLPPRSAPEVDLARFPGPCHLPMDLRTWLPRAARPGSLALDLGCGTQVHQEVCEYAGYEYVGLDYADPAALLLGDGQALPFRDGSFDFILSIAVFEHIPNPLLAMREAHRVLKPGGIFLGTIAFQEPFHSNSFFHHSHLGTLHALRFGGFQVHRVAPSEPFWSALDALANMGLFAGSPRWLARLLVSPLRPLHRLWWWAGGKVRPDATERNRILKNSGAVLFLASKAE